MKISDINIIITDNIINPIIVCNGVDRFNSRSRLLGSSLA